MSLHLADATNLWQISEEDRLRIACRAASIGVWQWDLLTNTMVYTEIAREICGFPQSGRVTLEMVLTVTHPDDVERTSAQARRALDPTQRAVGEFQYRIIRYDTGEVRWVKAYGEAQFAEVDGELSAVRYVGSIQDITEEKRKEDALSESEARLRLAIDAARLAVWELDVGTDQVAGSPELNRLYGFPESSTPTINDFRSRYAPGERERVAELGQKIMAAGETTLNFDFKIVWPDETFRTLLMRAEVGMNRENDGLRVIGVVADITELKNQEERLAEVAQELRHRLMNTVSVISALASRSWPADRPESKGDFQKRLAAIGKSTDLMFPRRGTIASVTLGQLLHEVTDVYRSAGSDPFEFDGPEIAVDEHVRPLAMAIHELATNAVKYGALSVPEGKVTVSWRTEPDGSLRIDWREAGGPAVSAPNDFGLGTTLLTKALFAPPHSTTVDYHRDGVRYRIHLRNPPRRREASPPA